jgi:hypothetical protein
VRNHSVDKSPADFYDVGRPETIEYLLLNQTGQAYVLAENLPEVMQNERLAKGFSSRISEVLPSLD